MSRKLIWGDFTDNFAVKVYKDSDTGEHVARLFVKKNGKQIVIPDADYFDSDKSSALSTAKHMLRNAIDSGNYTDSYKSNPTNNYDVVVGNIGYVYSGKSLSEARKHFAKYLTQSKTNYGRAGGEDVTLFENGEPIREHYGTMKENPGIPKTVRNLALKNKINVRLQDGIYTVYDKGENELLAQSRTGAMAKIKRLATMKKNPAKKKPRSKIPVFQVQVLRNKSWIKSVGLPHRWVKLNDMTTESGAIAMAKHYKLIWPVDTIRVIKK